MSFSDPAPSFVQPALFPNGLEAMEFWPQFPNEQHESNGQFDHGPPFKRPKNSDDSLPIIHNQRIPSTNPPVNHPTIGRMFFKTRLCAKFRMGKCPNGENCNFAHGDEDLRKPPPNWQELMAGRAENRGNGTGNWEDDDRIIHKMKLCKKFYNGEECPYGDRCNFLHKEPPKFKDNIVNNNNNNAARFREYSRESSAISIGTTGPPMVQGGLPDQYDMNRMGNGGMDASRGNSRPVYWKTRLCNRFEDTGHCAFGDKCHYAHGRTELLLPGGRPADSEPVATNNAPVKSTPTPSNEPAPVKVEMGDPSNQEGPVKKWFLKWKPNKKINRIYGDWIDDLDIILPDEVDS